MSTIDQGDNTLLHEVCHHEKLGVIQLLLAAGADVNRPNRLGHPPLYAACVDARFGSIQLLLAAGADAITKVWRFISKEAIEYQVDLNKQNEYGSSFLHYYSRFRDLHIDSTECCKGMETPCSWCFIVL